jgi:hypothetical protein
MVKRKVGLALAMGCRKRKKMPQVWSARRRAMLSRAMLDIWATWRREMRA